VAFVLALREFNDSPFTALDEFDVFMDAINRRTATETLLEVATKEMEKQFILLTPQVCRLCVLCLLSAERASCCGHALARLQRIAGQGGRQRL
jgi:hypothetical protein